MCLTEDIRRLEHRLLEPGIRVSPDVLTELLSDEFIEFGSSGRAYHKQDVVAHVPREDPAGFSITDFHVSELAPGVVLATYKLTKRFVVSAQTEYSLRSSVRRRFGPGWQIVFHQATWVRAP